jgi:hypothetical protein
MTISGVPFMGPIGAARVGFSNGAYVLNPSVDDMQKLRSNPEQRLDLVVAGTGDAVLMVESEAQELSEDTMLEAVMTGHRGFQQGQVQPAGIALEHRGDLPALDAHPGPDVAARAFRPAEPLARHHRQRGHDLAARQVRQHGAQHAGGIAQFGQPHQQARRCVPAWLADGGHVEVVIRPVAG